MLSKEVHTSERYVYAREEILAENGTLAQLKRATVAFKEDRPTLDQYHHIDPAFTLWLAWHEIQELNGKDKYGYFNSDERVSEYRQQELSDIIIFLQDVFDQLSTDDEALVFADETKIKEEAAIIAGEYGIKPVSSEKALGRAKTFTDDDEAIYEILRGKLNEAAEPLNPEKFAEWQMMPRDEKERILNTVMAYAYVMFYQLGLNPVQAAMEKVARNMLRYPPRLLQERAIDSTRYQKAVDQCKVQFDGKAEEVVVEQEVDGEVKEVIEKQRPQYGTVLFYEGPLSGAFLELMAEKNRDL